MQKLSVAALIVAVAVHSVAYAGYNVKTGVVISGTEAYGAMKATRNSAYAPEEIFCSNTDLNGYPLVECYAQDKVGHQLYCYVDNAPAWVVAEIAGVNDTSLVEFTQQSNSSQCATVTITNSSGNL